MTIRTALTARSLFVVAGSCLALGQRAGATGLTWGNALGGSAAIATNWNPNQIPTAADDLTFNLVANYSVSFPSSVPTSRTQVYRVGNVAATFSGHTVTSQLYVGQVAGNNATMTMGGTLTSSSFVTIGRDGGAVGVMNMTSSSARLTVSGAGIDMIVGQAGQGTLNLSNGADIGLDSTADDFIVGNLAGGVGAVTMTGGAVNPSGVAVNNSSGASDVIIGSGGSGTVTMNTNSFLASAHDVFIAVSAGSTGSLTMTANSGTTSAALTAPRDLHIGHNSAVAAAGVGTLTMNTGASATVGTLLTSVGTTFVGDADGGSGTINLRGGLLSTESLVIDPTNGQLNHTGGELRIAGGTYNANEMSVINGAVASDLPLLHYQGATGTLFGGFIVGNNLRGSLVIDQGSVVTTALGPTSSTLIVGSAAGSTGTLEVDGAGSRLTVAGINVVFAIGLSGSGTLNILNGGRIDSERLVTIGNSTGQNSFATVAGNAVFNIASTLSINGTANSGGSMSVSGGSAVNCSAFTLQAGRPLSVDASNIAATGTVTLNGITTLANGGQITGASVRVAGPLQGSGVLAGRVSVLAGGSVTLAGGDMTMGQANSSSGFSNAGTLNIGGGTARLLDLDMTTGGVVTIAGGQLIADNGMSLASITGNGSVTGAVELTSSSVVHPQAPLGLVFNGPVGGAGLTMTGTRIMFAAGGGFTGSGGIDATVETDEEAAITATGGLTMGNDDVTGAINLVGDLHLGANTVTLRSNTAALLGNNTTIAGGQLLGPASNPRIISFTGFSRTVFDAVPVRLAMGRMLEGFGAVGCKLVTQSGSQVRLTGDMGFVGSGSENTFIALFDFGRQYASWDGDLDVGTHAAAFTGVHRMGGTTTLAGGEVFADSLTIRGTVTGEGTLRCAPTGGVANIGVLRPGGSGAGEVGVDGPFTSSQVSLVGGEQFGTLELDIAGDPGAAHDVLRVASGDAALAGTLNVGLLSGAVEPYAEYPIIIVENGVVSGQFGEVNVPAGAAVQYRANGVVVVGVCIGDFNIDGGINGEDVGAFFDAWEAADASADVNQDGGVDGADVDRFFAAWESGSCV